METEVAREVDQGKKRKNKLEELLRRRRAPQSGSEGEDSDESSDEIFESDSEDEDLSDPCLLDSSSDEELDVVIEDGEENIIQPSLSELVEAVERTQLVPAIRLCLAWLRDQPEVLGQTGPGSEQLWHNLARMFTVLALQGKESITTSVEVTMIMEKVVTGGPLWEDCLLRGVFPQADEKIVWEGKLERREQEVVRLVRIGEMRDWLCGHQDSKIGWSVEVGQAFVKREQTGMGKKNVMKHMAELWLRQEGKELEKEAGKEV